MAQENLDFNINVKTSGAEGSIGSLKKQLREAQNEVMTLTDKFGATSVEAVNAAKKAAELRDRIGDAKALTDAYNPDAKFKALTASLSGVAGGFGAVQGAMALFGNESENVQKTLLKVQSAMALSQGLNAVGESIDAFKTLGNQISGNVVKAFSTLRGAIISTGIGALIVGVGLLVANFEEVKKTLLNLFPSLEGFGNKIKDIVQGITDFIGITSQAKRDAEALTQGVNAYIKSLDNSIKVLESQGGKEDEIYKAKKDRIEKQLSLIKGANAEEKQKIADLNAERTVLDNNEDNRIKKRDEDAAKLKEANRLKEQERNEASINANAAFELKVKQDLLKLDEKNAADKRAIDFQRNENLITDLEYQNQLLDNDFADDQQRLANKEAYIAEQKAIELSNLDLTELQRIEIIAKYAAKERDIDKEITASKKAETEARMALQFAVANAAGAAGKLLQDIAGENKTMAITGIILEQAAAIASISINASKNFVKDGGVTSPLAWVNLGAAGIQAASAVVAAKRGIDAINSSSSSSSGSIGGSGMPSISAQAPMIPQAPQAQVTQLNQQSINDIGNQAVRAYVIESDVTSNQQRIAAIRQRARFS
tara:strand:- start:22 stop:1815 length:1794 start_codon:yes stop_codon:yes gene_type:complete